MTQEQKNELIKKIEVILFAAGKSVSFKRLAELGEVKSSEAEEALCDLKARYEQSGSGLVILIHEHEAVLATAPEQADLVRQFLKKEELGELTRPQLEVLSVVSYRGPITKPELEQIRGVNCSLILRNLQIRGLVEAEEEGSRLPKYKVTMDFLRYLGLKDIKALPKYETLAHHENVERILTNAVAKSDTTKVS